MQDLSNIVGRLEGRPPADLSDAPLEEVRRCVAVVGASWTLGQSTADHYDRCFRLLHEAVKALRHATSARIPNISIERVWPLHLILHEDANGHFDAWNIVLVEHGHFGTAPATPEQLVVQP